MSETTGNSHADEAVKSTIKDVVDGICNYLNDADYSNPETIASGLDEALHKEFDTPVKLAIEYRDKCQKRTLEFQKKCSSSNVYLNKNLNWPAHQKLKELEKKLDAKSQMAKSYIDILDKQKRVMLDKIFKKALSVHISGLVDVLQMQSKDAQVDTEKPEWLPRDSFQAFIESGCREQLYYHIIHTNIRLGAIQTVCNKIGNGAEIILGDFHRARVMGDSFSNENAIKTASKPRKEESKEEFSPKVENVSEKELLKEAKEEPKPSKSITTNRVQYTSMEDL